MKNKFQIVFASKSKITEDAHQLVKELLNVEGSLLTNESILEDFLSFAGNESSIDKTREMLMERIADKFGVIIPEVLDGETRIYMVVKLIKEKQKKLLFPRMPKKRKLS